VPGISGSFGRHDWKALVEARLRTLAVNPARAIDIVDELAQHVAQHHAELVASGVPDDEALRRALEPLDHPERVSQAIARADRARPSAVEPPPSFGRRFFDGVIGDIRYAARVLARSKGFAFTAIVTLGLAIGANTTIFSVLHAVLLRPLPYAEPGRLVYVGDSNGTGGPGNTGYATFVDWKAQNHSFEDMAVIRPWTPTLALNGEPERIAALRVSANFFRLLGTRPALGRDFAAADDTPSTWQVVISDGLWRRRFSADPTVIGRRLRMNDKDFEVIGVMPPSFEPLISEHFYQRAEMWAALGYDLSLSYACRSCQHLKVLARLRRGTTAAAAAGEMTRVLASLRDRFPTDYARASIVAVRPLTDELSGNIRSALTALMGAVGFVLLIACANVANLLLARMARREHDLVLRAALGASRTRMVRQLLAESALLAFAGSLAGLALSAVAVPMLTHAAPVSLSRLSSAQLNPPVVAFALGLSLLTTLAFGVLPAMRASRVELSGAIAGDGRRTATAPNSPARRVLVAVDIALAVVLLAAAGLMIRSVGQLIGINPGFDPDGVLTMQISMAGQRFTEPGAVVRATDDIVARIQALPGVTGAAVAGQIPLGGNGDSWSLHVVGRPAGADDPSAERYAVTPQYFSVMRIPLIRGRLIAASDRPDTERVIVIGQRTAERVWPDADPIGAHVRTGGYDGPVYTVVGIVGDVRHSELAALPTMQWYGAQSQFADSVLTVVVRTTGDPASLTGNVRRAITSVAPDVPTDHVATLRDLVDRSVGSRRFVMLLLELFAAMALLMTAIGVYGVVAYSVSERTREFGVRAALGASRAELARLVIGSGLAVVVSGLAVGCVLAIAATRYLEASLFNVRPTDPLTFAAVVIVLLLVTLLAQTLPMLRATRIDPASALRQE
jgi:putative ABC transport system permease protein